MNETVISIPAAALPTRPRIAAFALWDNMVQPPARTADAVPWHGTAVTPEWITATVGAATAGAEAVSVDIVGGDNGSSARRILSIQWNAAGRAAGLPQRLFTKSTPTLAMRLSAGKAAPAEGRFLTDLRPAVPIEAPVCLLTLRDATSGRALHLMEDLTSTCGATFCSATSSIDRSQAEQIVDTLAVLHGTFLNPAQNQDRSWLRTYEHFFHAAARNGVEAGHDQAMLKAVDVIPARVSARRAQIWPAAVAALQDHEDHPRTVIHSDVHLGNWYVTADGRMGLSDWARVCRGHWTRDLAYALMTTVTIADRRNWERDLIERYLAGLQQTGQVTVDFDSAWNGYRRQAFAALLMWTPTLCPPPTLPDMQPEATSMQMIQRITTAIDDLDALDLF